MRKKETQTDGLLYKIEKTKVLNLSECRPSFKTRFNIDQAVPELDNLFVG